MKLLINASNLYVGGGVQVAVSFINELQKMNYDNKYFVFLSKKVKERLEIEEFDNRFKFFDVPKLSFYKIGKYLRQIENSINYDVAFTIFGPSYWKPSKVHLMGVADGWLYNDIDFLLKEKNLFQNLRTKSLLQLKRFFMKKDGGFFVLETNDAKKKFIRYFNINEDKVFVVGNTYNAIFDNLSYLEEKSKYYIDLNKKKGEFYLLTVANNYTHKNLSIIRKIIPILKEKNLKNIKFVLTLKEKDFYKNFGNFKEYIINVGEVDIRSVPSLYLQSDAMFLPTLLETFSASYPEAMKMKKPILTSNLSFAKDVCEDAALYFNPLDGNDIVEKIEMIYKDSNLYNELVNKGIKRVKTFETAKSRAEKYLEICNKIKAWK